MKRTFFHKLRVVEATLALASLLVAFAPHATAEKESSFTIQPGITAASTPASPNVDKAKLSAEFGKLPLSFEQNVGQTNPSVKFLARNPRYTLFLTSTEAVFVLRKFESGNRVRRQVLRMRLEGASAQPEVEGHDELINKSNYFIGGDRDAWRSNVNNFARVFYRGVYPGIDMVYYGQQRELEYDFIVAPQADPRAIKLSFKGAREISLDEQGNLRLKMKHGELSQPAPFIYQEVNGERKQIAGRFTITRDAKSSTNKTQSALVGFEVEAYDRSLPLVIDPKLLFSTYVGGNTEFIDIVEGQGDTAAGVAVDSSGNVYITGNTDSTDFPATSGAYQEELELRGDDACLIAGPLKCGDAFVLKLNTTGTQIQYATYLGGHNSDEGRAIAVDATGRAYITGGTDPFNAGNFCINPYL
ncbi:MAG: SBBP repeat-containing protein, partial [Pyrinomonadaceae bacterium]